MFAAFLQKYLILADSNGRYIDVFMRETLPQGLEVHCHFLPGGRTVDCIEYISRLPARFISGITAMVIHFGTNDVAAKNGTLCNARNVLKNIFSLCQYAQQCFKCPIYTTSLLPQVANMAFNDKMRYVNKRLPNMLQPCSVMLLDLTSIFFKSHRVLDNYFAGDGIHLNWKGKEVMAAIFHWAIRCEPNSGSVLRITDIGLESYAENQSAYVY